MPLTEPGSGGGRALDATDELPALDPAAYAARAAAPPAPPAALAAAAREVDAWSTRRGAPATESAPRTLAADLDSARVALRIERARTTELQRALEDSRAAARESREAGAVDAATLDGLRSEIGGLTATLAARAATLGEREAIEQRLRATAAEQSRRIVELEAALAAAQAPSPPQAAEAAIATALRGAERRATRLYESLQTREWQRGVWEGLWRELEAAQRPAAAPDAGLDARLAALEAALGAAEHGRGVAEAAATEQARAAGAALARADQQSAAADAARAESAAGVRQREAAEAARDEARAGAETLGAELARARHTTTALTGQVQELTLALERARGALEERELHMRRLERSAAQAPGRAAPATAPATAAAVAPALAALLPLDGEAVAPVILGARTRIGRALDNELQLDTPAVSRHHAMLLITPRGAFVEDLDSVNGVGVNGRRVRHAQLVDGDVLTIGLSRFRFTAGLPHGK